MQLVYVFRPESDGTSLVSCLNLKTALSGSWALAPGAGTNPSLCYIDLCRYMATTARQRRQSRNGHLQSEMSVEGARCAGMT